MGPPSSFSFFHERILLCPTATVNVGPSEAEDLLRGRAEGAMTAGETTPAMTNGKATGDRPTPVRDGRLEVARTIVLTIAGAAIPAVGVPTGTGRARGPLAANAMRETADATIEAVTTEADKAPASVAATIGGAVRIGGAVQTGVDARTGAEPAPEIPNAPTVLPMTVVLPMTDVLGTATVEVLARNDGEAEPTVALAEPTVAVVTVAEAIGVEVVRIATLGERPVGEVAKADSTRTVAKGFGPNVVRPVRTNPICRTTSRPRNSIRPSVATC